MIDSKDNALLIESEKDHDTYKKYNSINKIVIDDALFQILNDQQIELFDYQFKNVEKINYSIGKLVNSWYRDNTGKSFFIVDDINIGGQIQYKLALSFTASLKYYFFFKHNSKSYKKIYVSDKSSENLKIIIPYFGDKIEFYDGKETFDRDLSINPNRGKIASPRVISFFSIILRCLQVFIRFKIKKKVLVFNDWTYPKLDNLNVLNMNSLNIIKSFCMRNGKKFFKNYKKKFDIELNSKIIKKNISSLISDDFGIDHDSIRDARDIFSKVLKLEHKTSVKNLIKIHCAVNELFDFYKPSMLILPGYAHPLYQSLYEKAKLNDIPTMHVIDGFPFFFDKNYFPNDKNNKGSLISYFASFTEANTKMINKAFKNDYYSIIKLYPPILKIIQKQRSIKTNKNKALVLFPYPNEQSISARWDKRCIEVINVINVLIELSIKEITIKIKPNELNNNIFKYEKIIRNYFSSLKFYDIKMTFDDRTLEQSLGDHSFVIGSIGASIIETSYYKIPYYTHEPVSNGLTRTEIELCTLNKNKISRCKSSLKKNILEKNYVVINMNELYIDQDLNNLNYEKLINSFKRKDEKNNFI